MTTDPHVFSDHEGREFRPLYITTNHLQEEGIEPGSTVLLDPLPVGVWSADRYTGHLVGIRLSGSYYLARITLSDPLHIVEICGSEYRCSLDDVEIVGVVESSVSSVGKSIALRRVEDR